LGNLLFSIGLLWLCSVPDLK